MIVKLFDGHSIGEKDFVAKRIKWFPPENSTKYGWGLAGQAIYISLKSVCSSEHNSFIKSLNSWFLFSQGGRAPSYDQSNYGQQGSYDQHSGYNPHQGSYDEQSNYDQQHDSYNQNQSYHSQRENYSHHTQGKIYWPLIIIFFHLQNYL